MSIAAKLLYGAARLSGVKKMYAMPKAEFDRKLSRMNADRNFYMPKDSKRHYERLMIDDTFSCLKIMVSEKPSERAILFFFGGGMLLGPDKGDIAVARKLSIETGCDLWLLYYPLCTLNSIRTSIEISFECYRQMVEIYGAGNVSTCGFSSGGMLAIAVGLYNNTLPPEQRQPMPRHIVAVSPGEVPCDEAEERRMEAQNATDPMVDYAFMKEVERYMRHGEEDIPAWMIHPTQGDYSGLPKIWFFYSTDEVLYGARENYEAACRKYGTAYEVEARSGMVHCYAMLPYFPEGKESFRKIGKILSE